jgi:hypothetical protein
MPSASGKRPKTERLRVWSRRGEMQREGAPRATRFVRRRRRMARARARRPTATLRRRAGRSEERPRSCGPRPGVRRARSAMPRGRGQTSCGPKQWAARRRSSARLDEPRRGWSSCWTCSVRSHLSSRTCSSLNPAEGGTSCSAGTLPRPRSSTRLSGLTLSATLLPRRLLL